MPTALARRPNSYHDSGVLMRLAERLAAEPGVRRAAALMGTPANRELLVRQGFPSIQAEPSDLIVAVEADRREAAEAALGRIDVHLAHRPASSSATAGTVPHTLDEALNRLPQANLLVLSTPGAHAPREARAALERGLHVFMFSDNVPIEDEIALKRLARARGLLLMGPDCGTALIGGHVLGFGNRVRRGAIGLVGASGTGIQEVSSLIDRLGAGVAHAIGTGGRDLKDEVGGVMTCHALSRLAEDPAVRTLVIISKPPGRRAGEKLLEVIARLRQPVVSYLPGFDEKAILEAGAVPARSLEEAAARAVFADELGRSGHDRGAVIQAMIARPWRWDEGALFDEDLAARVLLNAAIGRLASERRWVRGLYAGGTLAEEARRLLSERGIQTASQLGASGDGSGAGHLLVDLGDDEFTRGRAHPMIDPRARNEQLAAAARDAAVAVLLFDVVLGIGSHPDPAGALLPALGDLRAATPGQSPIACAAVVGTDSDPQPRRAQVEKLRAAGVIVFSSHARAVRAVADALATRRPR